jgi:hypothetical protein
MAVIFALTSTVLTVTPPGTPSVKLVELVSAAGGGGEVVVQAEREKSVITSSTRVPIPIDLRFSFRPDWVRMKFVLSFLKFVFCLAGPTPIDASRFYG